ncbi:MAG TPA: tetratricopeptide repeat protein [Gemmatimonadales bacterium]|nr:tetratricopeptide repeat protein [Gemmatimonadales bacterium]
MSAPPPPPAPSRPVRPTLVEVPPLELEPDFDAATTDESHEVDDEPLADDTVESIVDAPTTLDLGTDGILNQDLTADMFAGIEAAPEPSSVDEIEAKVADDPDNPDLHRALGEALIESGEGERGVQELEMAVDGYETRDDVAAADGLVEEMLRLDPNSVRHRQKRVEYAFRSGEKAQLIDAYVELADTLLRIDLPDKARAVYLRVVEHDPKNARAQAALALLAPSPAPTPREERVAPKDAKLTVRDTAGTEGDFIDLGALILDHDEPRDSRIKVEEEEPTGDEEKDFHEMLARFRQGIDENIDEGDFQSHYDLGVAFKEMGLVDEAIAEFQKALRAPEGKLRAVEALGACFLDKGAFVVAESILRRGLELPAASDQERLGVLYSLGRALEAQGRRPDARDLYQRVFAVDVKFKDVDERMKALGKAK